MVRMMMILVILLIWLPACEMENTEKTAPEGYSLVMSASPDRLPADGRSQSKIEVLAFGEDGAVEDETVIHFTASLGTIESRAETRDGIARVTFTAGETDGAALITATSGQSIASAEIQLGVQAAAVTVTAQPASILAPDVDAWGDYASTIIATVWDGEGNPLPNAPVMFTTTMGELQSQGAIRYTDSDGQVRDLLRLRLKLYPGETVEATVAAVAGGVEGETTVTVTRVID